jgi:hypothetical protein
VSEYVKEAAPKYRIGSEPRGKDDYARSGVPGPGQYEIDRTMKKKGAKFGTGVRTASKTAESPGPGNYNLPKVTGHLASYYPQGAKIPSYD